MLSVNVWPKLRPNIYTFRRTSSISLSHHRFLFDSDDFEQLTVTLAWFCWKCIKTAKETPEDFGGWEYMKEICNIKWHKSSGMKSPEEDRIRKRIAAEEVETLVWKGTIVKLWSVCELACFKMEIFVFYSVSLRTWSASARWIKTNHLKETKFVIHNLVMQGISFSPQPITF